MKRALLDELVHYVVLDDALSTGSAEQVLEVINNNLAMDLSEA